MKRTLWVALVAVLVAVAVAACGGHKTVTTIQTQTSTATATTTALAPTAAAPSLKCPAGDITMQCVLATQPPPASPRNPELAAGQQYGIDFGWGAVSALGAKSIGAQFGASYLSTDPTKNWTVALVNSYHAAGLKTVAVWETSADRTSTEGGGSDGTFAAGVADAREARQLASDLGMPADRVIEFATDCDCTPSTLDGFFEGADSVLGVRDVGDYGGYQQVLWLSQHHLVGPENWQTYAWSDGRWLPASIAPLEQYLNGNAFDNDRSLAPLYGQWPASVPKPIDPRHPDWLPNTRRKLIYTQETSGGPSRFALYAREREAVQHWDGWGCRVPTVRVKCQEDQQHLQLLDARLYSIAHHTGKHLHHLAKKARWGAVHYVAKDGHKTTLGGAFHQLLERERGHKPVTKW